MFLKIEGGRLLNLDLVTLVEPHPRNTASVWDGGVNIVAESRIVHRYFFGGEHGLAEEFPPKKNPVLDTMPTADHEFVTSV
jgi:hypothetical protein